MRLKFSLLCSIIILVIFWTIFTFKVSAASPNSILIDMVPSNPSPYEDVVINLNSYADNLDVVLISWSINNKNIISGIGKKSFSITAPAAGEETNVVATISLTSGTIDTKITIKPSVMILLWQAEDSYVPPFYKGKALPTPGSAIKVVAMPEVKIGSSNVLPQNITYYWKKDYTNNVDGSGYGKNFFVYTNDYLEDSNNISVTASTVDQRYSSDASVNIGATESKILFYRNDNNLGTIWDKVLTDPYKIEGPEIVEAVPYFVSPKEIQNPTLVWSWFINDDRVNLTSFKKNLMPLQIQEGTHGTSKLKLSIENTDSLFEAITKEINIQF